MEQILLIGRRPMALYMVFGAVVSAQQLQKALLSAQVIQNKSIFDVYTSCDAFLVLI